MKSFTIDGQTLRYQDVGNGPVLLLGHDYFWDHTMWAPQVERLSQTYRCIVPDFWGHGLSDTPPSSMRTLADYAKHILALMDHLDITHFSLLGSSLGGIWSVEMTLLAPQRVRSLVLIDAFVGFEPQVANEAYFLLLDQLQDKASLSSEWVERFVERLFSPLNQEMHPDLVSALTTRLAAVRHEQVVALADIGRQLFGRRDCCEDIERLALPALIIVGAHNKPRPVLESYLMQDALTGSELVVVDGAGHICNLAQPDEVNLALTRFFNGIHRI